MAKNFFISAALKGGFVLFVGEYDLRLIKVLTAA